MKKADTAKCLLIFLASLDVEINPRFYRGKKKGFSKDKTGELKASPKLLGNH